MNFSSDFKRIDSGYVKTINEKGAIEEDIFGKDLHYELYGNIN